MPHVCMYMSHSITTFPKVNTPHKLICAFLRRVGTITTIAKSNRLCKLSLWTITTRHWDIEADLHDEGKFFHHFSHHFLLVFSFSLRFFIILSSTSFPLIWGSKISDFHGEGNVFTTKVYNYLVSDPWWFDLISSHILGRSFSIRKRPMVSQFEILWLPLYLFPCTNCF